MDARARRHKCRWTPAEQHAIIYGIGYESLPQIARALGRSPAAVREKAADLRINPRSVASRANGMSSGDVVAALGLSGHWTVHRWVRDGWLRARYARVMKRAYLSVDPDDLYTFLCERGGYLDLTPSPIWRELVEQAQAAFHARYIRADVLRDALCIAYVTNARKKAGFPRIAFKGYGGTGAYYDRAAVRAWLDAHPKFWTRAARMALAAREEG